jgi:hypothetical protein
MTELLQNDSSEQSPEEQRSPFGRRIVGALILVIVLLGIYFQFIPPRHPPAKNVETRAAFSGEELAYAARLQLVDLSMSRAENFLNQEVTTLSIDIVNGGDRSLRTLDVPAEFYDDLQQIVLRETRSILLPNATAFVPGERRTFEISIEHIPTSWNMQQPTLRIAGLEFTSRKE